MRKIYKLKQWYSLEEASKRLTLSLGEEITIKDILQMAIEGHLPLSCYMRHITAQKIFPYTKILNWDITYQKLSERFNHTSTIKFDRSKVTHASHSYDETPEIEHITGAYTLELEECGAIKDYILSIITDTESKLTSIEGYFVKDSNGGLLRIMERFDYKYFDKTHPRKPIMHPDNYYPSDEYPDVEDLGIQKKDIEDFENLLCNETQKNFSNTSKNASNSNESQTKRKLNNLLKLLYNVAEVKFNHSAGKESATANKLSSLSSVTKQTLEGWLKKGYELSLDDK